MGQKLRRVLLIDDNPADNYLHTRVLRKAGCAEQIDVCETAILALQYLQTEADGRLPQPEIIFLDINMPGMDGWEFLDAYRELSPEQRGEVVIAMLTSLPRSATEEKLSRYPELARFSNKPLTLETLRGVLDEYFPHVSCA